MSILVVTFMVESNLGYIADFIPETLASPGGIALFIAIAAVFAVGGILLLRSIKTETTNTRIHFSVNIVQYVLIAIIAVTIAQILATAQYSTIEIAATHVISYGLWIAILSLLSVKFVSWIRNTGSNKRNLVVFILMLSMIAYVLNGLTGMATHLIMLQEQQKDVVTSEDVAYFPEFDPASLYGQIDVVYIVIAVIAYVLTWIGTVLLLRPYIHRIGKVKFYAIMGAAMVYYLIEFPLFTLGYFTPTEETEQQVMNNILIFGIASVLTGIIFGVAFLAVARTLRKDNMLRQYMIIAAGGFVLFYVAGSVYATQAAYPPYGLASVAFTGLSCYLIYVGLYSAAVSVSQDYQVRESIRNSVMKDSHRFLEEMGMGQMQQERQKLVLSVAKKSAEQLAEDTGVESSMTEDDMKDYMETVMNELKDKR
jgi:hypothetical protein